MIPPPTPEECDEVFGRLRVVYKSCFTAPGSALVLQDLAKFCHAAETCAVPGNRDQTLINEGHREAFLRIQNFLNLTTEELTTLRLGRVTRRQDNV